MHKVMFENVMKKLKTVESLPTSEQFDSLPETVITPSEGHAHQWVKVSQTYAPPRRQLVQGLEGEVLQHALFGVTTFLWECLMCKQLRKAYAYGSELTQLDELLDKTELYGPQYIQRDNITYTIQRYIPMNQSAQTVPVR